MYAMSHAKARHARLMPVLAALIFSPARHGLAGDQGGGHDKVQTGLQDYSNYDAAPPPSASQPCESCLNGAMGSGYVPPVPLDQTYTNYSAGPRPGGTGALRPCKKGELGGGRQVRPDQAGDLPAPEHRGIRTLAPCFRLDS